MYKDAEFGFSFDYPTEASISGVVKDEMGYYVLVNSPKLDLTVSIDSLGYDPGTFGADKSWEVPVNGSTWTARYDKPGKCIDPTCLSMTTFETKMHGYEVGLGFKGDLTNENDMEKILATFKFLE